ncbi:hypothetical protein JOD78_003268 [Herbaspirillum sp. 1130]|nr:hypothetical protein [Herbaspirillum sp. 1130]
MARCEGRKAASGGEGGLVRFQHARPLNQDFGYINRDPYSGAVFFHICFSHIERRKYSFFLDSRLINLCAPKQQNIRERIC